MKVRFYLFSVIVWISIIMSSCGTVRKGEVVDQNPNDFSYWLKKGSSYYLREKYLAAEDAYKKALRLSYSRLDSLGVAKSYYNLAILHLAQEKLESSLEHSASSLLAAEGTNFLTQSLLAHIKICLELRKESRAFEHWEKIGFDDIMSAEWRGSWFEVTCELGYLKKNKDLLVKVIEGKGKESPLVHRANCYISMIEGDWDAAFIYGNKELEKRSMNPDVDSAHVYIILAEIHKQKKEFSLYAQRILDGIQVYVGHGYGRKARLYMNVLKNEPIGANTQKRLLDLSKLLGQE